MQYTIQRGEPLPTYEYQCEACGRRYEKREGFDAPSRQKCQYCGKSARRILHAPPIVFKGSGFYKTDSRGTSSASTDGGAEPSSKSDKSEAKPAKSEKASADSKSSDSSTTEAAAAS